MKKFEKLKLWIHLKIYSLLIKQRGNLVTLGTKETWTLLPDLDRESFVISGGAGHDISFELELIALCSCNVILLDPSLPGATTVENLNEKPAELIFLKKGLAANSGVHYLSRPDSNEDQKSWQISEETAGVEHHFTTLSQLLKDNKKSQIDFLKIDIEGFEYEVLNQVLRDKIPIRQICVEIHQGKSFGSKTRWHRWWLIIRMLNFGYFLIHYKNWDHTFYKRG